MSRYCNRIFLNDMVDMRDGLKKCAYLGMNDANDIINEVCIN